MKPALTGTLIALQLITVGLVVGVIVRRNGPDGAAQELNQRLERVAMSLEGALHRQQQIAIVMDELRQRWQQAPVPTAAPAAPPGEASGDDGSKGVATESATLGTNHDPVGPDSANVARSPFPEATAALAKLKHAVLAHADARAAESTNLSPLETEIAQCRSALIALGHQAIFVVRQEVDLQPFEPGRDVRFVEHLLLEIVPSLSSAAKEEAFDIARSALVRQTNEPALKLAGATALQQIDGDKWWKDVIDVAKLGSSREVTLRCQLMGLFVDHPHPAVVDLCLQLLSEARYPPELRNQAIFVIAKQDSSAVNPALRRVVFEEPNALMKNHAFDALWQRLEPAPADRRKLLEDVLATNPAQMPDAIRVKAEQLRAELEGKPTQGESAVPSAAKPTGN